jgi:hypothetical protein
MPLSSRLIRRRNLMVANPNVAPQIKLVFEKKNLQVCELKLLSLKQRVRYMLVEIFQRHEEFLGWTPD